MAGSRGDVDPSGRGRNEALIYIPVAIVVDAVTVDLPSRFPDGRILVVTILAAQIAVSIAVGLVGNFAIAVIIYAVAQLRCPRVTLGIRIIAVLAPPGAVAVAVRFVRRDLTVAICIFAVAALLGAGISLGVAVVTVTRTDQDPVAIRVHLVGSRSATAVGIQSVAYLVCIRKYRGIGVVAVPIHNGPAVVVGIGHRIVRVHGAAHDGNEHE